jgi:hypothetical protein
MDSLRRTSGDILSRLKLEFDTTMELHDFTPWLRQPTLRISRTKKSWIPQPFAADGKWNIANPFHIGAKQLFRCFAK